MFQLMLSLGLLVSIANASIITNNGIYATSSLGVDNNEIIEFASTTFSGTPLMRVAYCESRYTQFDTDTLPLKGEIDRDDTGFMQINKKYHLSEAIDLGYDLDTAYGNIMFSLWLYNKEGIQPWSASQNCIKESYSHVVFK